MSRAQFKIEQGEIVKTFGQRLREARELCNLSQAAAAKKLGYANSSKLAKLENATDTNSVPLWLIVRAAKLYDASVDFLFGMSEDWERDAKVAQERDVYRWLREELERGQAAEIHERRKLRNQVETMEGAITDITPTVVRCREAVGRFSELNSGFEDMPAGGMVVGAVERAENAVNCALSAMRRYKVNYTIAGAAGVEPDTELLAKSLKELAALSPLEYDQVRQDRAAQLGVRVGVLDKQVALSRRLFGRTGHMKIQARLFVE